jgi:futalosine hydrolase
MHTLPIVLAGATRKELQAALTLLDFGLVIADEGPTPWVHRDQPFLLLVTGIGPVNAAYTLGRLIGERRDRIKGVLNVGVAGAFTFEDHRLGEPVIIDKEIWPEFGLWTEQGVDPRGLGLPHGRTGSAPIWNELPLCSEENAQAMGLAVPGEWKRASSITVAGASGTLARAASLHLTYGITVENMEGFALGWACHMAKLPFLELRVISNVVGDRSSWDLHGALGSLGSVVQQMLTGR